MTKPTIHELEKLLDEPDGKYEVVLNPDGSVTTAERKPHDCRSDPAVQELVRAARGVHVALRERAKWLSDESNLNGDATSRGRACEAGFIVRTKLKPLTDALSKFPLE